MATSFQLTIDCRDPATLVRFWGRPWAMSWTTARRLPTGNAWYRSVGVSEEALLPDDDAVDRLVDPAGTGPRSGSK